MSLGTLGIRVRYQKADEHSFIVEAELPIEENRDTWQKVGLVYPVEYEDGKEAWEFEALSGRTSPGRNRKTAAGRGMILMGYATRLGDVLEEIPREERDRGRRPNAQ